MLRRLVFEQLQIDEHRVRAEIPRIDDLIDARKQERNDYWWLEWWVRVIQQRSDGHNVGEKRVLDVWNMKSKKATGTSV